MFKTSGGLLLVNSGTFEILKKNKKQGFGGGRGEEGYFSAIRKMCLSTQTWGCSLVCSVNFVIQNMRSKKVGRCILVYSATFVIRKHLCSNEAGGCFLVYSGTFVIWKHVCSNQGGLCFFVYSVTFLIRGNMYVQIKRGTAFIIRKIYVQNKRNAAALVY